MNSRKTKVLVLVCSGMADEPLESLRGRTPLEIAKTPHLDALAREGRVGLARTVPPGMSPAGEVGILSLLGYDPKRYGVARGPLEAARWGVRLRDEDVVFRCNLVTCDAGRLVDDSAGQISSQEAVSLMKRVVERLGSEMVTFHLGEQHRHLAVFQDAAWSERLLKTRCASAREVLGKRICDHQPQGPAADELMRLMDASRQVLESHEVNQVRIDLNENPGNMIWLWGHGQRVNLPTFGERWKATGSLVASVGFVQGAGRLAGLEMVQVAAPEADDGADHRLKTAAALERLKGQDVVFVHVEAADQAGRQGDIRRKIGAIENFDRQVVGPLWEQARGFKPCRFWVVADHATPVEKRARTADLVPFVVWGEGIAPDGTDSFGETRAREGGWQVEAAHEFLPLLLTQERM